MRLQFGNNSVTFFRIWRQRSHVTTPSMPSWHWPLAISTPSSLSPSAQTSTRVSLSAYFVTVMAKIGKSCTWTRHISSSYYSLVQSYAYISCILLKNSIIQLTWINHCGCGLYSERQFFRFAFRMYNFGDCIIKNLGWHCDTYYFYFYLEAHEKKVHPSWLRRASPYLPPERESILQPTVPKDSEALLS